MVLHKHRVVPGHAGGKYEKGNIILCPPEIHAYLHRIRYGKYGDEYDKIAADCLRGLVGKEELRIKVQREAMRKWRDNNPDKVVAVCEAMNEGFKRWYEDNPQAAEISRANGSVNAQPISIDRIEYSSIREAARQTGITRQTIIYRLKVGKDGYRYL